MLAAGVNPKIIQERHGHTRISTTLVIYTHALPDMQAEAAEALYAHLEGISGHEGEVTVK